MYFMYQSKLHANPGKILINNCFGVSISYSWAHLYFRVSHSFNWLHLAVAILRDFVNCSLFLLYSPIRKYWQNMKIPRLYCHTDSLKCLIVMQSRFLKIMRVKLLFCGLFYTAVMLCYINLCVQKSTAKGICELYEFFSVFVCELRCYIFVISDIKTTNFLRWNQLILPMYSHCPYYCLYCPNDTILK